MAKKEPLSERLRRAIRQCGMSRYALSKQTGISEATLSRFVVGRRGLMIDHADLLVEALGLELVAKGGRKRAKKGGA